jgi:Sulfotransferase family
MIISHKYKFVFVKTYKTAGTSLETYLSDYCGDEDILTEIYPPVSNHQARNVGAFYNHMPASLIRRALGHSLWGSYFKFCVERNPWDKVLSYYWMERHRAGGLLGLDDFLTSEQIGINWPLYTDEDQNRPIVDKVLRYESLDEDLKAVFDQLSLPWNGKLTPKAKSEYRSDRTHYREVLTASQADQIAQRFKKEIDWHGYQF